MSVKEKWMALKGKKGTRMARRGSWWWVEGEMSRVKTERDKDRERGRRKSWIR